MLVSGGGGIQGGSAGRETYGQTPAIEPAANHMSCLERSPKQWVARKESDHRSGAIDHVFEALYRPVCGVCGGEGEGYAAVP